MTRSALGSLILFLVAAMLASAVGSADAASCIDYAPYTRWTSVLGLAGVFAGAAIDSPYVYLCGDRLDVLDLSDPSLPALVSSTTMPHDGWEMVVQGDYAYVGSQRGYLMIYDIADPSTPSLVSTTAADGNHYSFSLLVAGNYAYPGSLVVDVSDRVHPQIVGSTGINLRKIVGSVGYGYSWADSTFRVIDLSDPTSPAPLGSVHAAFPDIGFPLDVSGSLATVAGSNGVEDVVDLIDISNPSLPEVVGSVAGFLQTMRPSLFQAGQILYMSGLEGAAMWDVSDPTSPQPLGSIQGEISPQILVHGGTLGLAGYGSCPSILPCTSEIDFFDLTHPGTPPPLGSAGSSGATGVALSGQTAYAVGASAGLQVIDISNPETPSVLGSVPTPGSGWDVAVNGSYAYVADDTFGVQVVDVANPMAPAIAATVPTVDRAWALAAQGSYVYVADFNGGFRVVDVSDPLAPTLAGGISLGGASLGVAVRGSRAYVANGSSGVYVIDITDPTMPTVLGSVDPPGQARGVAVVGDLVYLASVSGGLHILDVSNPYAPTLLGSVHTPGGAKNVAVSGSFAYVTGDYFGTLVVNVANPTAPTVIGNLQGYARDVAVGDVVCTGGKPTFWPRQCGITTGVEPPDTPPIVARLLQSRPNPFTGPRTVIPFSLARSGNVTLQIFDLSGRRVRSLVDDYLESGDHVAPWDGRDDRGRPAAAGIYFYRLTIPGYAATRRLVRLP